MFQLAQINIARFRLPADHPANADFMAALDRVNAAADAHDGFVWRLIGDGGNAMDVRAFDDPNMQINMSVWRDLEALGAFVYRSPLHRPIMVRRKEWFEPTTPYLALWWVPAGHIPSIEEGKAALDHLAAHGPTPRAFTFANPFPAPGQTAIAPVLDRCA